MKKCFLFALVGFQASAQPVIINQPANQTVVLGGNAMFSVMATGVGPLTYQWQFNGTNLPNNVITTVAGTNISGFFGDGGAATNARLSSPQGVAVDGCGNFLIADSANNRIRRVDTNGIISTIAGTNFSGFSGDGGAANLAGLSGPYGVGVDVWGNYWVADRGNNRIRLVDTNGMITTVAGTNAYSYSGDGGPATNASMRSPSGVTVDGYSNLFIADYNNLRIRKVDTNGIISTIAGNGVFGFSGDGSAATNASFKSPQGVALDSCGNLFIADTANNRIRMVDTNGTITTIAGTNASGYAGDGGPAARASLSGPAGVTIDSFGYVFIADTMNHRVRQVDSSGTITTVAGNGTTSFSGDGGPATNASLYQPSSVAMDSSGGLLIADTIHSRIRRITLGRIPNLRLGNVTTTNAGNYQVIVTSPSGSVTSSIVTLSIAFPPSIVAQPQNAVATNNYPAQFSVTVAGTGPLSYQWFFNSTAVNGETNSVLSFASATTNLAGNYVCVITNAYGGVTSGIATLIVLTPPSIIGQPTNQMVVSGSSVTMNVTVSGSGPFTYQWRLNGTNLPNRNNLITRVAGVASVSGYNGDGGIATSAFLSGPSGVAIDAAGELFIADTGNNRIRMVDTNFVSTTNGPIGIIKTVAGTNQPGGFSGDGGPAVTAKLSAPISVAVDASGNFYISDVSNNRVRKVDKTGMITTLAGTNSAGFSGDGGLAVNAQLNGPTSLAMDNSGNLFIADKSNNRIRKVHTNGIITTVAGTNTAGFSGDGGLAVVGQLKAPAAVAVDDGGNLFIADRGNNCVRKVDVNGIITTFAGNGTAAFAGDGGLATNASLNQPNGLAVDAYHDVFISDSYNNRIRMVDVRGNISTVTGTGGTTYSGDGGMATNAGIYHPASVAVDAFGNTFITDSAGPIRKADFGRMPMLSLNNVAATNAGNYDVIVTSPYGSVTSSIASLTLYLPPFITLQPTSVAAPVGGSASLNVAVSGTAPFSYQWFTCSGRTAVAEPLFMAAGHVISAIVVDGGAGYVSTPNVQFVGGGGSGAAATAPILSGSVYSINIISQGSGYTSPPAILISSPTSTINSLLPAETNAVMEFPSATSANATNYFVTVSNNYGSVTSTIVMLRVFIAPQNFSAQNLGASLQLSFSGTPIYPYILQSTTNLMPPITWRSIATNFADTNGNWSFTVTNLTDSPEQFYRVFGK